MHTVELQEAHGHLTELIEMAVQGEHVVIARAGQPQVKLVSLIEPVAKAQKRLGFLQGQIMVPDDFDQMGSALIASLFGSKK